MSPAFTFDMERKQRNIGIFVSPNNIVLNQVFINHERVYADIVVSSFRFVRSFSPQQHSIFLPTLLLKVFSRSVIKLEKPDPSFTRQISNFRSSRNFNDHKTPAVIVFLLNEGVHGAKKICNGSVKTGFQILKVRRLWNCFCQKTWTFPLWHFATLTGRIMPKLQPPIDLPDSVAPVKFVKESECTFSTNWRSCFWNEV